VQLALHPARSALAPITLHAPQRGGLRSAAGDLPTPHHPSCARASGALEQELRSRELHSGLAPPPPCAPQVRRILVGLESSVADGGPPVFAALQGALSALRHGAQFFFFDMDMLHTYVTWIC